MSNWAKDYLKYSNETGGGGSFKRGSGGNNGPGCGGILVFILLIWMIIDILSRM